MINEPLDETTEQEKAIENKIIDIIRPIMDKHDPKQLLSMGCPIDEYASCYRRIASAIIREGLGKMSAKELGNLLAFSWHHDFSPWHNRVDYQFDFYLIAEEIHPLLPKSQRELVLNH